MSRSDLLTGIAPEQTKFRVTSWGLVARGVVSNWTYLVVNVLVAFWMTPFVVRHLGDTSYGLWALVLQLTGYMGVVDVGLRSALVRFVSRFKAQDDDEGLNRLMNSAFTLYALMVPVCFMIAAVIAFLALPYMHIPAAMLGVARITVFIAAGCIACDFLFATSHASLAGLSRWDLINSVWISVLVVRTVLILLFLKSSFGLLALATIQLSVTFVGYCVEMFLLRHILPRFRLAWHFPRFAEMRPIAQHGWYSFLLSVATKVNYQIDSVVIAFFLPIDQVTFYVIGLRLVEYLRELLSSTTMVIAPVISSFEAVGELRRITAALIRSTKYSLCVGLLGASVLLALGTDFIRLWMGPKFAERSGVVLVILSMGVVLSCTQFAASHVLYGMSKHRLNVKWTVIEAALNLAFSLALVRRYGIIGVAAGTTIANAVIRAWLFPRSVLRELQITWKPYIRGGMLPALGPALSFLAGAMLYKTFSSIENYGELILALILGLLPFLVCLWFVGMDEQDRKIIRQKRQLGLSARVA
jgi:O-antigen/teichoic acid export membrane protein